ncbi:MAG: 3-hydroxyacyl-ACP dehydratase FabZ [Candidatus Neomarinimicrobiota bacterium]|nr:3-hydroxyacyl-[acyl-carrier-protein] dehydratase FabZ [Candidatus Neomarinimicrobiota bacterium]MEC7849969.1 3-hydroxyacyl-ACP dehydratase FabZ [Candidatus Neomarinimicrobiota bacterium]MED5553676.1 3-hydroxyacyl-ACP dehydratase FabZ [Candidatus Neomarinimicrobiota bacterium]
MSDDLKKDNYNIQDIIKILPHRYPFILIDRIDEVKPGEYVNAIKNVTINEPYFQGHFPGQPVMPGVLSLESIAQTTAFLMLYELDDPLKKNMFISGVDGVRFRRLIVPGDQLHINIRLKSKKLTLYKFEGTIKIDGKLAVQAIITSNLVDRVEV